MSQYWSSLVNQLKPYTPGEQPKIEGLVKLNTNENPYGPSPRVLAAINAACDSQLRKYPDPNADSLKDALAKHHQLNTNQVFVGNSSDEVLAHVFRGLLKHDAPILFPDLTYSFYPTYCSLFEINYVQVPLNDQFEIDIDDYSVANGGIIFANPNAPTGHYLSLDKIKKLAQRNPSRVIVIDEAYVDFAEQSAIGLIEQFPNVLVTQTFSKSRSLAGLRVGMAFGHPELIEALERIKNSFHPYALDKLAIEGAVAAVEDIQYFAETVKKVCATREWTSKELKRLEFDVLPSQANFLLVQHKCRKGKELFDLLRDHKILVRRFDHPRISNYLRISIGSGTEMQTLINVFDQILAS